jgi:hypothetical protein
MSITEEPSKVTADEEAPLDWASAPKALVDLLDLRGRCLDFASS